ncbi:MAG: hypothetical protein K6E38_02620 [Fretibacterium sp.]|nr:hypothetical protein [Fretibacterium sp.]
MGQLARRNYTAFERLRAQGVTGINRALQGTLRQPYGTTMGEASENAFH